MDDQTADLVGGAAKFIVGAGILGFLVWKTPLLECLYLSLYIVVVPMLFLTSVGLMSQGTFAFLMSGAENFRSRVDEHINKIKNQQRAAA